MPPYGELKMSQRPLAYEDPRRGWMSFGYKTDIFSQRANGKYMRVAQ